MSWLGKHLASPRFLSAWKSTLTPALICNLRGAEACLRARAGVPYALPRRQASLAVSGDGEGWFLINVPPIFSDRRGVLLNGRFRLVFPGSRYRLSCPGSDQALSINDARCAPRSITTASDGSRRPALKKGPRRLWPDHRRLVAGMQETNDESEWDSATLPS
jgi:hypothetical protein